MNTRRVLLVEDDAHTAAFARAVFRREIGANVVHAPTLAEALAQVQQHAFDLIVLDLNLPDADGVQAVERVRGATTLPILVSSSAHERERASLDAGANAFLPKADYDAQGFADAVRAVLLPLIGAGS